jgi:hypothetical protein
MKFFKSMDNKQSMNPVWKIPNPLDLGEDKK